MPKIKILLLIAAFLTCTIAEQPSIADHEFDSRADGLPPPILPPHQRRLLQAANDNLQEHMAKLDGANAKLQEYKVKLDDANAKLQEYKVKLDDANAKNARLQEDKAKLQEDKGNLGAATPAHALQAITGILTGGQPTTAAPTSFSNPAKCAGDTQDHSVLRGTLDCESRPKEDGNEDGNKGSQCLDNLSSGKFYQSNFKGKGLCKEFGSPNTFMRKTYVDNDNDSTRRGTISKSFIAHQHEAGKEYGVISGKRMKCVGDICHVFKTGLCIKCPKNVFRDDKEQKAEQEDINKFYDCCIMGRTRYRQGSSGNAPQSNCRSEFRNTDEGPPGAFTEINSATATLKPSYRCWDGSESDVAGKFAMEAAQDMMKAS